MRGFFGSAYERSSVQNSISADRQHPRRAVRFALSFTDYHNRGQICSGEAGVGGAEYADAVGVRIEKKAMGFKED